MLRIWLALIVATSVADAFLLSGQVSRVFTSPRSVQRYSVCYSHVRMSAESSDQFRTQTGNILDVRIGRRAALALPLAGILVKEEPAAAATGYVVVLGATGATGQECVNALVQRNMKVRAVVRSTTNSKGKIFSVPEKGADLVEVVIGDVSKREDLESVIKGASGVIFAASASKKGGNPQKVDYQGLVDTAQICIKQNVPRLVVVSSGGVSKPDSSIYRLLNLFGEIMFYKFKVISPSTRAFSLPSSAIHSLPGILFDNINKIYAITLLNLPPLRLPRIPLPSFLSLSLPRFLTPSLSSPRFPPHPP
jgi:hypothetical protein